MNLQENLIENILVIGPDIRDIHKTNAKNIYIDSVPPKLLYSHK